MKSMIYFSFTIFFGFFLGFSFEKALVFFKIIQEGTIWDIIFFILSIIIILIGFLQNEEIQMILLEISERKFEKIENLESENYKMLYLEKKDD